MLTVYPIHNDAEAALVDTALAPLLQGGDAAPLLLVADAVTRTRWTRAAEVLRVGDLPATGVPAAQKLLTLAVEVGGSDTVFCSPDTLLLDTRMAAGRSIQPRVWGMDYGGFCTPAHWLWGIHRAAAQQLLTLLHDMTATGLGAMLAQDHAAPAAVERAASLSPAALCYSLAAANAIPTALHADYMVWTHPDHTAAPLPPGTWCVHCGSPDYVSPYPDPAQAIIRAQKAALHRARV